MISKAVGRSAIGCRRRAGNLKSVLQVCDICAECDHHPMWGTIQRVHHLALGHVTAVGIAFRVRWLRGAAVSLD